MLLIHPNNCARFFYFFIIAPVIDCSDGRLVSGGMDSKICIWSATGVLKQPFNLEQTFGFDSEADIDMRNTFCLHVLCKS
jgi:hypothetical protein